VPGRLVDPITQPSIADTRTTPPWKIGGARDHFYRCGHTTIAYASCANRHCPKCQGSQAREWLEARKAELLDVPYFHVVFTLPPAIGAIA
jgi:hypothetical protein